MAFLNYLLTNSTEPGPDSMRNTLPSSQGILCLIELEFTSLQMPKSEALFKIP
jgi:hypothetical protein